jgi:DNA-binding transcriptional LysR family regulator
MMLDWDDLRYFLAVQRARTLAGASAVLGINATTVGRRLTGLEERIGARLFDRTPTGYSLTAAGHDLVDRAERMENEALAAERSVLGADQRVGGTVRVNMTEMLATRFVTPLLAGFHDAHPEITLDLSCSNRSVHLGRREADIALRLARPHEENVVTRQLAKIPLRLYASREYVERWGLPTDPERSLGQHRVLMFADRPSFRIENQWLEQRRDGARIVLRSDSVSSLYSATVAGVGIALLPSKVAENEPDLVRLATESEPEPRVVWQTVHVDLQRSARIRAVLDFFQAVLLGRKNVGVPRDD